MNSVSGCCLRPIITGRKMEYPLGVSTYGIAYKVDICESCGLEVEEPILVHSCCGTEICECVEVSV